jgi:hypothetical protein
MNVGPTHGNSRETVERPETAAERQVVQEGLRCPACGHLPDTQPVEQFYRYVLYVCGCL